MCAFYDSQGAMCTTILETVTYANRTMEFALPNVGWRTAEVFLLDDDWRPIYPSVIPEWAR